MQSSKPQNPGPRSGGAYTVIWREIVSFIFDVRFLQVLGQIIFVIILVALVSRITTDMLSALDAQNLTPNFSFFENRAGFEIGERPDWYTPDSSYWSAFAVGIVNTLRVVVTGLITATVLGILVGIFLLSNNWLTRSISRVYVELLRNTPLLVQLFVWYFIVVLSLPVMRDAIELPAEGVALFPIRLILYALALILIMRQYPRGHTRRQPFLLGLFMAIVTAEVALHQLANNPDWPARGDITNGPFLLYVVISAALLAGAWFLPNLLKSLRRDEAVTLNDEGEEIIGTLLGMSYRQWRNLALGLVGGQFIGGLLYYFHILPSNALRAEVYPLMYLSNRGFFFPEFSTTARFSEWLAFVGLGILAAVGIWAYYGRILETTGRVVPRERYAILAIIGFAAAGWFLVGIEPGPQTITVEQDGVPVMMSIEDAREADLLTLDDELLYSRSPLIIARPERQGLRFAVGTEITPEYMALFLGLAIYTSAFIAEIVRAGIQAVPNGQLEAARALGLNQSQTLRMIVLPQALRVIIPPLGNQYLNLAKNSSLAIAIGFADFYQISTTVMNQSGQSVTGIAVVMIAYLTISLTISGGANWINRRFQLVTR